MTLIFWHPGTGR